MKTSSTSCLISTATTAMAPPSPSDPTSPMKISAGCALYQRKPRLAPVIEPQKIVSSCVCAIARQLEILGELHVAARVGQDRQRAGGDHHQADREAVQTVRQIHRVGHEDHHQRHEDAERRDAEHIGPRVASSAIRSAATG